MNILSKMLLIISLSSVASFSQQNNSTSKAASQVASVSVAPAKDDSQKELKKVLSVRKTPTTWTKIKDLFM
jgi:hypothetical protein